MLTADRRRARIAARVEYQGHVSVAELIRDMRVSRMTVYRDLALLEAEGRLRRVRCGARAFPSAQFEDGADWMTWRLANGQAA
ncbi:DeoR family transcriptional regulator [Streptomyces sp. NPDC001691]|uniref:DeoR family transcriptional regulator n=1 Tax=unclassified Streptomyces TaxID=2593676 RepID=UPI0011C03BAA|nr:DeoR family transcriptional regulator [Streptomyces sp. SDr-06]